MSNLIKHAEKELKLAGYFDKDSPYDGMIGEAVLALIKVFSNQNHSGMSASIVNSVFSRVADYKPLGPLTGEPSEWNEIRKGEYQNNRYSEVFKNEKQFNGKAYTINAKVFSDDNGESFYSSSDSVAVIYFPYIPKDPERVILPPKAEK